MIASQNPALEAERLTRGGSVGTGHTPPPWRAEAPLDGKGKILVGDEPQERQLVNAAFIVRAVNAHQETLDALEVIRTVATEPHHPNALNAILAIAERVLAQVKEGGQ